MRGVEHARDVVERQAGVLEHADEHEPAERLDDLARGFGVPTLWRDTVKVFSSSASTVFTTEGIPGFLLEVGGGQPLDPADIRLQADAVRGFLRKLGILPGPAPRLKSYTLVTGYRIVTNSRGGFFDAAAKPGDRVKEGSVLGTITDVHGVTHPSRDCRARLFIRCVGVAHGHN